MKVTLEAAIEWSDDLADPNSAAYQELAAFVESWLDDFVGAALEALGLEFEMVLEVINPNDSDSNDPANDDDRRKRRSTNAPKLDITLNISGEVDESTSMSDLGDTVANSVSDSLSDAVKEGGDFVADVEPEVETPDLCSPENSIAICQLGEIGVKIPLCGLPATAVPFLGDDTSCTGTEDGDYMTFISGPGCEIDPITEDGQTKYQGTVTWMAGRQRSVITRTQRVVVEFECVFEESYQMSTENGVQTLLDQRRVDLGSSEGQVELTFGLYESDSFETLLPANTEVNVPDKVRIHAIHFVTNILALLGGQSGRKYKNRSSKLLGYAGR